MDKKTLAKLIVLAKRDPNIAANLEKQASAVSDADLETIAGGDYCVLASCFFSSACWVDASETNAEKQCKSVTDDSCKSLF